MGCFLAYFPESLSVSSLLMSEIRGHFIFPSFLISTTENKQDLGGLSGQERWDLQTPPSPDIRDLGSVREHPLPSCHSGSRHLRKVVLILGLNLAVLHRHPSPHSLLAPGSDLFKFLGRGLGWAGQHLSFQLLTFGGLLGGGGLSDLKMYFPSRFW